MCKLDDSISSCEVFPREYEVFRKDRRDTNLGGGLFIAVHNSIYATRQTQLDCQAESKRIKLHIANQKPVFLTSFYRLPGYNLQPFAAIKETLNKLQSNGSFPRIVIAGDMSIGTLLSSMELHNMVLNQLNILRYYW